MALPVIYIPDSLVQELDLVIITFRSDILGGGGELLPVKNRVNFICCLAKLLTAKSSETAESE